MYPYVYLHICKYARPYIYTSARTHAVREWYTYIMYAHTFTAYLYGQLILYQSLISVSHCTHIILETCANDSYSKNSESVPFNSVFLSVSIKTVGVGCVVLFLGHSVRSRDHSERNGLYVHTRCWHDSWAREWLHTVCQTRISIRQANDRICMYTVTLHGYMCSYDISTGMYQL